MNTNQNSVIVGKVYELAGIWIDTITDAAHRGATESAKIGCQMVMGELSVLRTELDPGQPGYQRAANAIMWLHQKIANIEADLNL